MGRSVPTRILERRRVGRVERHDRRSMTPMTTLADPTSTGSTKRLAGPVPGRYDAPEPTPRRTRRPGGGQPPNGWISRQLAQYNAQPDERPRRMAANRASSGDHHADAYDAAARRTTRRRVPPTTPGTGGRNRTSVYNFNKRRPDSDASVPHRVGPITQAAYNGAPRHPTRPTGSACRALESHHLDVSSPATRGGQHRRFPRTRPAPVCHPEGRLHRTHDVRHPRRVRTSTDSGAISKAETTPTR